MAGTVSTVYTIALSQDIMVKALHCLILSTRDVKAHEIDLIPNVQSKIEARAYQRRKKDSLA